ncbi:MAG: glutamate 5-kinase [Pseudomonadota bacterium]
MSAALDSVLRSEGTLVVKIGSSLLINDDGRPREHWMANLTQRLSSREGPIVLVSSGAIALGRSALDLESRPSLLAQAQAAAAVGQIHLAEAWSRAWQAQDRVAAQILLTLGDLEQRRRYLNARATLETLLERGIVPVVNENDTVATEEIRFGDNDRLAARVAQLLGAEGLILLSDVNGLYDRDPGHHYDAQHIPLVDMITPEIEAMAGASASTDVGTGGMVSKLAAARIATAGGVPVWLASGLSDDPIQALIDGGRHTEFAASVRPLAQRKQWLSGLQQVAGTLLIDSGAAKALHSGASLLAVGLNGVFGEFERGDVVLIEDERGVIGKGLSAYSAEDASRIAGCKSKEIEQRLGGVSRGAVIHRDDIVLEG